MDEVLIVGANGFLGQELTRKCLEKEWIADVVVNQSRDRVPDGVRSIVNTEALEQLSGRDYKYIFNVAAFIPYGSYNVPNEQLIRSNVTLPLRLHATFPNAKMIFSSSVSVYGNNTGLIDEKSDCVSPTLYGLSKWSGELITAHHAKYAILRFSSLYASGMYGGTFIPRVLGDARSKHAITLLGDGGRKQNYLHVSDAANYCIHAALYGNNEIYLGVSTEAHSNREVAEIVASLLEKTDIIYTGSDGSPSFLYDNSATRAVLQFTPSVKLPEGIKELIDE
jgi:UDP-glucose 4-epimerase